MIEVDMTREKSDRICFLCFLRDQYMKLTKLFLTTFDPYYAELAAEVARAEKELRNGR